MLDENEFLSPYRLRSVSLFHHENSYVFHTGNQEYRVECVLGEGTSYLFAGNSNWRSHLVSNRLPIIEALERYQHFYGDKFKVERDVGSGQILKLQEVSQELSRRLSCIFLPNEERRTAIRRRAYTLRTRPALVRISQSCVTNIYVGSMGLAAATSAILDSRSI